jgi:hypothetical protein
MEAATVQGLQRPPRPTVTVVMTCRERHGLTETAIESVIRNTHMPFRFLYVDVCSPEWLRKRIEDRAREWSLEVARFDEPLWPNQARRRVARTIDTDYAAFIDDDVLVSPNWLEHLIQCAEETGAGVVGPLYLWGDSEQADRIHMAGGQLSEEREADGIVLKESHAYLNRKLGEVELHRRECGFVEFHCMLMRREVFRAPETFHERIVCVHEHIHACLTARALGYKTCFEPKARVTYLAYAPYAFSDLPVFRRRWSSGACDDSLNAFAETWGVINDDRSFGVRSYVAQHREEVDPLRPSLQDPSVARAPIEPGNLKHSPVGLAELAAAKGYGADDIQQISKAYWSALLLSNGGYRPCGRPFINHLVGTASILVHYGFARRLILAALLHAAYTHAPRLPGGPQHTVDVVARNIGGRDSIVERLVRAYTLRSSRWRHLLGLENWTDVATMTDVEIAILAMANDVELHLSGEVRATGRTDADDQPALAKAREICDLLCVPGLAEPGLRQTPKAEPRSALPKSRSTGSFRIEGTKPVPMVNRAFFDALAAQPQGDAQVASSHADERL